MRSRAIALGLALTVAIALSVPARSTDGLAAGSVLSVVPKKVCKTVTKKIHGVKKKVKVCRTKRPATPTPTVTATPNPAGLPPLTTTPAPVSVALQSDQARGVQQTISAQTGGSITATDARGTTYVLSVPPNALDADTKISVTPVDSIDHLPLSGGTIGAALLQPQGLTFWRPVTLTIRPAHPAPVSSEHLLVGFGLQDDGSELHLSPLQGDTGTLALSLNHFTGGGAAIGTPAEVSGQVQHPPTDPMAQYEQLQAALAANQQWVKVHPGLDLSIAPLYSTEALVQAEVQLLTKAYDTSIKPHLEDALTDAYNAYRALQQATAWERAAEKQNLTDAVKSRLNELQMLIPRLLDHILQRLSQRCTSAARTLAYYPVLGWFIDLPDALSLYAAYRTFTEREGLLASDDAYLKRLFLPCRPRGFTFDLTVQYSGHFITLGTASGTWAAVNTVTARVCATDPYSTAWDFKQQWQLNATQPLQQSGTFNFDATTGQLQPVGGPTYVYQIFIGLGSSNAIATLTFPLPTGADQRPTVELKAHITDNASGVVDSPRDVDVTVPVTEDVTCPPPT